MQQAYTRIKIKNHFYKGGKFLFKVVFVLKCVAVALLGHPTSNTTGHFKCVIQNTLKTSRMRQYSSMNKFRTSPESRVLEARFESLVCCLTELRGSVYILPALHKALS